MISSHSSPLARRANAVLTGLMSVAALAVAVKVLIGGSVFPPTPPPPPPPPGDYPVENWDELVSAGHRSGPEDAVLTMVVFTDLECPGCRQFHLTAVEPLLKEYPEDLAVIYRHWPLDYHRFAYPGARAAECAAEQGAFFPFLDAVFANQDSLGLRSFASYAAAAGVGDLERFSACASTSDPVPAADRDRALVRQVGGTGTPTIVINGVRKGRPMSYQEVKDLIEKSRP